MKRLGSGITPLLEVFMGDLIYDENNEIYITNLMIKQLH